MNEMSGDAPARLRLVESWLPLALAESEQYGWGYDSPRLEDLILLSAPSLRHAPTLLAARAILWNAHQRLERGRR